jgi:ubiquinone/menaquinone biosynthesis C-methylase UbiE
MTQDPQAVLEDKQGWNQYWGKKKHSGGVLYDVIAEFYRKFLIRPSLNGFIRKYFPAGSILLHAGCGSGQVDADIRNYAKITGLDISPGALEIYRRENGTLCETMHGSIFQILVADATFDGIYNLGVMEHFSEEEIGRILVEFKRVLKPHGKIVFFWPPEFGLSVIFFKVLKRVLKVLTGKEYKFHPDEICRIQSREHTEIMIRNAKLSVVEYAFGPKDVFTYAVVVAEKKF